VEFKTKVASILVAIPLLCGKLARNAKRNWWRLRLRTPTVTTSILRRFIHVIHGTNTAIGCHQGFYQGGAIFWDKVTSTNLVVMPKKSGGPNPEKEQSCPPKNIARLQPPNISCTYSCLITRGQCSKVRSNRGASALSYFPSTNFPSNVWNILTWKGISKINCKKQTGT